MLKTKKQLDLEYKQLAFQLDQRELALTHQLNTLSAPIKRELDEIALERRMAWNKFKADCAEIDAMAPEGPLEARRQAAVESRAIRRSISLNRLTALRTVYEADVQRFDEKIAELRAPSDNLDLMRYNDVLAANAEKARSRVSKKLSAIKTQIAALETEEEQLIDLEGPSEDG
jgi:hypothetical protein